MKTADIKKVLLKKQPAKRVSWESAISSGSTMLNLACTDTPHCAFINGKYYYLVGDSASGKTWLSLTCFAELCRNKNFQKHRMVFDNVEDGALMDMEYYFGKEVARRIETPSKDSKGRPVYSETIENFYYHLEKLIEAGRPFIYVLDSQDALESKAAEAKFKKQRKAAEDGEESAGSYGDGKAKYHSERMRHVMHGLRKTNSILIVIGHTKDNLNTFSFGEKKRTTGGKSLRYYATLEIWTSVKQLLKKAVRGKDRTIGAICLAQVKKNRVSGKIGKDREVEIPILYDYGIDDVSSCVNYLLAERHWSKKQGIIKAREFSFEGKRGALIHHIESNNLEIKLRKLVSEVWREIEEECRPERKKRYE